MSAADYVTTFAAIVLGLAVTDLATSLHRLLRGRARVKWDYLSLLAGLGAGLSCVSGWWVLYDDFAGTVTLGEFLPTFVLLVLLFLLASAALPDEVPADGLDLRAYYMNNRRYFWGLFAVWMVSVLIRDGWMAIHRGGDAREALAATWSNALFIPMALLLTWTARPWVHLLGLVACLAAVAAWLGASVGT